MKQPHWLAIVLLTAVGLSNSIADLVRSPTLTRFALASVASPLPRAFSQSGSLTVFAREVTLEITHGDGKAERRVEPAELFAGLPGPYERRVIYAAALSIGPRVSNVSFTSILHYGFCDRGPLARSMGIAVPLRRVVVIGPAPRNAKAAEPRIAIDCESANAH